MYRLTGISLFLLLTLAFYQDVMAAKGFINVRVLQNSIVELQCRYPKGFFIVYPDGGDELDFEACSLGADGSLIVRLKPDINLQHSDEYICQNSGNTIAALRVTVEKENKTWQSDQSLLKSGSNSSIVLSDVCSRNITSRRLTWKNNGKTICDYNALCQDAKEAVQHDGIQYGPILCVVFIASLVLAVFIIGFIYVQRRSTEISSLCELYDELTTNEQSKHGLRVSSRPLHQQVDELPYDLTYEIRVHRLKIKKVISDGNYGRVYAGDLRYRGLRKEFLHVVVKVPKRSAKYDDMKALAEELKIMMAIGEHPNVSCLIGVITENLKRGGDLCGIYEETACTLKAFLTERKEHFINDLTVCKASHSQSQMADAISEESDRSLGGPITTSFLTLVDYQVANGMEYLSRKQCVHRDLAARNILMCKNRTVRVSGFGQDRQWDVEYWMRSIQYSSPYKTMARESISTSQFTEQSDVWSYGILLWEIYSLGDDPFKGFKTPQALEEFYAKGKRLTRPDYMPPAISDLMSHCWNEEPDDRPNFSTCKEVLAEIATQESPERFDALQNLLNDEYLKMRRYVEQRDGPSHEMIRTRRKASQFLKKV